MSIFSTRKVFAFPESFDDEMDSLALYYHVHLSPFVYAIDPFPHPSLIISPISSYRNPVMSALALSMNMHATRSGKIDFLSDARARNLALARSAGSECRREVYSPKRHSMTYRLDMHVGVALSPYLTQDSDPRRPHKPNIYLTLNMVALSQFSHPFLPLTPPPHPNHHQANQGGVDQLSFRQTAA